MKKHLILLLCITSNLIGLSQDPKTIQLTFNKTVHLIFPAEVYYYDVGSADILVDQKNGIIKLAPKKEGFEQTNLTVVTLDNVWYTFLLDYKNDIKDLTYFIRSSDGKKVEGAFVKNVESQNKKSNSMGLSTDKDSTLENDYISCCREIVQKAPLYWNVAASSKKVYLALTNIYIHRDKLYFVISLGNTSNINYDINFIQMSIVNKKRLKRSSIQEIIQKPLFVYNKTDKLPAKTKELFMVLVYDKFTIPGDQKLVFEMYEKKGGRNISFDIKKDLIGSALPIK